MTDDDAYGLRPNELIAYRYRYSLYVTRYMQNQTPISHPRSPITMFGDSYDKMIKIKSAII